MMVQKVDQKGPKVSKGMISLQQNRTEIHAKGKAVNLSETQWTSVGFNFSQVMSDVSHLWHLALALPDSLKAFSACKLQSTDTLWNTIKSRPLL